jgi:hypothetical protein
MQGVTSIQSPPAAELHAGGTDASNEPTADPTAAGVRRVIEKQIQLNVFVPRTLQQSRVQHVRFRRNTLRIHTVRALPSRSFQCQNVFADCRVTFAVATLIARFRRNSQGNSAEIRRVTIARGRKANRACVGLFIRWDEKAGLTNGMR